MCSTWIYVSVPAPAWGILFFVRAAYLFRYIRCCSLFFRLFFFSVPYLRLVDTVVDWRTRRQPGLCELMIVFEFSGPKHSAQRLELCALVLCLRNCTRCTLDALCSGARNYYAPGHAIYIASIIHEINDSVQLLTKFDVFNVFFFDNFYVLHKRHIECIYIFEGLILNRAAPAVLLFCIFWRLLRE